MASDPFTALHPVTLEAEREIEEAHDRWNETDEDDAEGDDCDGIALPIIAHHRDGVD